MLSEQCGASQRSLSAPGARPVVLFYNLAMPRLAWFTPLPPSRSGIAAYSAELLPLIARRHAVDTFIDPRAPEPVDLGLPVFRSHEFLQRHRAKPYDLVVYQLGNAPWHDYMWPYLVRFPGMAVLHDGQLHQARAMTLLNSGRSGEYRQEFAFCHPDANPGLAEFVIAGRGGSLFFLWPLLRVPVASSRLVAVHSPWLAADLHEQYPGQEFRVIRMGVSDPLAASPRADARDAPCDPRRRHGIPSDRLLFAAYGMLTPEKRLLEIFKGLQSVLPYAPHAHLMLVGQPVDYYDVRADARAVGVEREVTITEYVADEDLGAYLAAADACLCLRWPTSRETSASWLRCLAAGKPTVITDLAHNAWVPALDPRSWTPLAGAWAGRAGEAAGAGRSGEEQEVPTPGSLTRSSPPTCPSPPTSPARPVCIAIDIVDEQHSLGLAMRRLALDHALRQELGANAREYWSCHHTPERMADHYEVAIEAALARPDPDRSGMPAHLFQDGTGLTGAILDRFGLSLHTLGWTETAR